MHNIVLSDEEQRKVEEGEAASFLLANPLFIRAISAVREQCAEAILTSAPPAHEAREAAYHLSRGLSAVTEELATLATVGAQIVAQAEALNEPLLDLSHE